VPYTNYYTNILNKLIFNNSKDIADNSTLVFSGRSVNFITLKPWGERQNTSEQLLRKFTPIAETIPGIKVSFSVPDPVSYGSDADDGDVVLYVGSFKNTDYLLKYSDNILEQLKSYPGVHNVNSDLKYNTMAYNITFNRDMAASVGVNLQDIADTFSIMMSGKHITDVLSGNQTYQVIVQMDQKDLKSFKNLNKIYVASTTGEMIPLSNLVTIKKEVRQSSLSRYKRMNSAKITADISPGYALGDVYQHIQSIVSSEKGDISVAYGGRIAAFMESNGTMLGLFLLALIFIYLVLAAQFESFVDPFIILLTVPLSLVGALFTMLITGGELNLFTNIGLITLLGLISKHGILITQFANESLKSGASLYDAIKEGAVTRFRPIMMTTCAMVLGSIPLAFSTGPGSVSKSMLGFTLVGGLIFGTIFSLIIIPVVYVILSPLDHKKRKVIYPKKDNTDNYIN
jgi:multidrug efflux pump subunit AcrB